MNAFGNLCIGFAVSLVIFNLGALPIILPYAIVILLIGLCAKKLDFYLLEKKMEKNRKEEQKTLEISETNFVEEKREEIEQQVEVSSSEKNIEIETDSWKCPKCGEMNSKKFCKECGTERPVIQTTHADSSRRA